MRAMLIRQSQSYFFPFGALILLYSWGHPWEKKEGGWGLLWIQDPGAVSLLFWMIFLTGLFLSELQWQPLKD